MEFTMLENGLDFIISAIRHLKEAEHEDCENKEQEIKYSLLHLSSGIELILKSRLYREHWTYIFSDMNKANKEHLRAGSFKSVDSSTLVERLKRLCDVEIDNKSDKAFESLRRLRNQMEHFTVKSNFHSIEACINNALGAITKFITKNYNDFTTPMSINLNDDDAEFGLTNKEERLIKELIRCTSELKEHYDDAVEMATARANDEAVLEELVECPSCKESLLKLNYNGSNMCYCFFCEYKEDGEKASNEYISSILGLSKYEILKDGGEYPLYECLDCEAYSMVDIDGRYVCFSCGVYYDENEVAFCNECGVLYLKDGNDLGICSSCIEHKTEKW
ncbi:hypothetical protein PN290_00365 [Romboutsia sp. 1001216sp1]|uniref:hypothetical protein n=1 Tax=unclassified Romboutsia TaxID=2626894 RepID=UPI0018AC771C|nr:MULTISPECIES: hypothetical protein [unclassified Romboutsia]MDB8794263.1 hypothetical protein [Romboutsia sp. 1001216sp1]MDB8796432.1 hypothetical protein [Romboutsia sp. 1001216sp1]MDB8797815.1 hypothetical protein [Romboutsia sp. 1001216sp1]